MTNAGNQLTADATHSYHDNGNLTRKTLLAMGNYTQYTYDAENRLTQVQEFAVGNPTAITTSSYRYDGLGRRIEKVANGQTTRYIYDGEDMLLEYNGSNVLQARYTHGPGIDEPLSRTPMVPGLGSGQTAVLASTPDGLRGPVVDDGIKVNGQVSVGFVFVSGMPAPAIGQPIDSTGLEQPIAPIDVTAAAATGTLAVAVGTGVGSELRRPLGIAIVGGLLVSQILTLYTTPVVYLFLDRLRLRWMRARAAALHPAS